MKTVVLCAMLLAGCSLSRADQAERDYKFMAAQKSSPSEMCEAARRVQDAYRQERNAAKYEQWRLTAGVSCQRADQLRAYGA